MSNTVPQSTVISYPTFDHRERYPAPRAEVTRVAGYGFFAGEDQFNIIGQEVIGRLSWMATPDVIQRLAEYLAALGSETNSLNPMDFWRASAGPELMENVIDNNDCGNGGDTRCFNLMMLATSLDISVGIDAGVTAAVEMGTERVRRRLETSRNIGLEDFCIANQDQLVVIIANRMRADSGNISIAAPVASLQRSAIFRQTLQITFAANWLSFCPNLIPHVSAQHRLNIFYMNLTRAKYMLFEFRNQGVISFDDVPRDQAFENAQATLLGSVDIVRNGFGASTFDSIRFRGEQGIGPGVLTNWMDLVSGQIFSRERGMFESQSDNKYYQLSAGGGDSATLRQTLRAAGRFVGLMLYSKKPIAGDFSRMFLAKLTGRILGYEVLQEYEGQIYGFFNQAREHGGASGIDVPDAGVSENGQEPVLALDADGSPIWPENEADRITILDRAATNYATQFASEKFEAFTNGLFEVVPREAFESGISTIELRSILYGSMDINTDDMFGNWRLQGYSDSDIQITWLKSIIRGWTEDDRRKFVHFVTGSSQIPASGFVGYRDAFTIRRRVRAPRGRLPDAHNCYNTIDLPDSYPDEDHMKRMLEDAIRQSEAFGTA